MTRKVNERTETLELRDCPWFVGLHPEYLNRILGPSKLYLSFVAARTGILDEVVLKTQNMEHAVNGILTNVVNAEYLVRFWKTKFREQ